ncbi:Methyltransferase domain-containing protein [Streptomyces sp. DvalAA-14]|uniref:class I SAM-dependent methyltransferase n=1 Tax=unclassified Streptomyces TaxID=2593676 RepID=UPI00081BB42F|nr:MULTISPECIES: class I SAM-dependent methyltransferase [unclassified Streptomyces]MYS19487.1 methyltransferase domain-containing protein [Streptomyces sp. SID4948]SCD45672.1 Methyltransferase domain-containing protein [Streptomyces sp. DvalAA-14]
MATHDDPAGDSAADSAADQPYDPVLFARRASSFGAVAAAYAEHRPDYPEAAVRWALEPAFESTDAVLDVLDLGAGTGKLTATLVALGHEVTAVEPDDDMRAALRTHLPEVTALAGGAENIPLPDASVDAVVVGQAFHWFDQDRALPEIARVLRPGGSLAALWNTDDDRVDWIAELGRIAGSRVSFIDWNPARRIDAHPAYSPVERADFPHRQRRTVDSLIATVATHSHILVLEPAQQAEVLGRVRELLESRPETADGGFDLKLITRAQRCVRTG